jgi:putative acyl-CoA dehydrogenase
LVDQPLMRSVLADMAHHVEATTALVMRLCHAFDRAPDDPVESAYMRLMTPVVKYWVCKSAPAFLYEAMECLGGNGYVEESIMARHYREAPVNAIWEGSGNVMCLDVLRVVSRERDAAAAALAHLAQEGGDLPEVKAALSAVAAALGQPDAEGVARDAVERLALAAAAVALKAVHPGHAALFAQTRLAQRRGLMYGAVDLTPGDIQGLLARALP